MNPNLKLSQSLRKRKFIIILCSLLFAGLLYPANLSPASGNSPGEPLSTGEVPAIFLESMVGKAYLPIIGQNAVLPTQPTPDPPPGPQLGIWISGAELASLPTSGPAWDQLLRAAQANPGTPDLGNQSDNSNIYYLAKALVYARTGETQFRDQVLAALQSVVSNPSEEAGTTLSLGRELAAYVIAADLVNLAVQDPALDTMFRARLRGLLTKPISGWGSPLRTLRETHELRPNNWGTHAGASRAAVAVYLGDVAELGRMVQVFQGYLGDRNLYSGFEYDEDLTWQCDPARPVGINQKGCSKNGHSIDGALPEEMRRGARFRWPPVKTNYPWEALQGALVQAEILSRAGYPAWEWQDKALLRAVQFLYNIGWEPEGDDEWQIWLVNYAYGTQFHTVLPAQSGKNIGWTDWTHSIPR